MNLDLSLFPIMRYSDSFCSPIGVVSPILRPSLPSELRPGRVGSPVFQDAFSIINMDLSFPIVRYSGLCCSPIGVVSPILRPSLPSELRPGRVGSPVFQDAFSIINMDLSFPIVRYSGLCCSPIGVVSPILGPYLPSELRPGRVGSPVFQDAFEVFHY